jgi:hypothetical protein
MRFEPPLFSLFPLSFPFRVRGNTSKKGRKENARCTDSQKKQAIEKKKGTRK